MFEIKMSQGAKPGKGGMLPGAKVNQEIARIRGIRIGENAFSPNRHKDIRNHGDLLDMIQRIREVTGKPVGFKTVIGSPEMLDELFSEVCQRGIDAAPDFITVDGAEGGTGAAPMPLIDAVGLPLRESLPMVVDKLEAYGLRDRVKVLASGKLVNPEEVACALCLGADFVSSAGRSRGWHFWRYAVDQPSARRRTDTRRFSAGYVPGWFAWCGGVGPESVATIQSIAFGIVIFSLFVQAPLVEPLLKRCGLLGKESTSLMPN